MSETGDYFREEDDLTAWASELGASYVPGTQGSESQQPIREMSDGRLDAFSDRVVQRMRELSGLPILADERESALHVTNEALDDMTETERDEWLRSSLLWLIDNPTATINNLILPPSHPPTLPEID